MRSKIKFVRKKTRVGGFSTFLATIIIPLLLRNLKAKSYGHELSFHNIRIHVLPKTVFNNVHDGRIDACYKRRFAIDPGLFHSFCATSCHSIGRVNGKCNADFTDCDCTDEKVKN